MQSAMNKCLFVCLFSLFFCGFFFFFCGKAEINETRKIGNKVEVLVGGGKTRF